MDITLPPDFKEFLRLLNTHGVEYLLIGGYAVGYHGYPRATNDMDIWIAASEENARRVSHALVAFGFRPETVPPELFAQVGKVFRLGVAPVRLEILTRISGVRFEDAYPRRTVAQLEDVSFNVISLDDLRANKKAAGRPKDLGDLDNLK